VAFFVDFLFTGSKKLNGVSKKCAAVITLTYTQGEMTSRYLWSRYDRHFVGITWDNVWS